MQNALVREVAIAKFPFVSGLNKTEVYFSLQYNSPKVDRPAWQWRGSIMFNLHLPPLVQMAAPSFHHHIIIPVNRRGEINSFLLRAPLQVAYNIAAQTHWPSLVTWPSFCKGSWEM